LGINALVFIPPHKLEEGKSQFNAVPPSISYTAQNGTTYELPTDVRPAGGPMKAAALTPALLCDANIPKRPGCSISRKDDDDKNDTGTIGLKVFRGKTPLILSCYHVLCAPELDNGVKVFSSASLVGSDRIVSPSREDSNSGSEIGSVVDGELNEMLDGAIMIIDDTITIRDKICSIDIRPDGILHVTKEHADRHHAVQSVGRTSGVIRGTIEFHSATCDVDYMINNKTETITFQRVILTNQIVTGGDSGAAVLDHDNKVIGILAACSEKMSCIVPIERLLSRFSITLNPSI